MLRGFFVAISCRFAILKQKTNGKKMTEQQRQLPTEIMKKAVRGISYIAHPLRLRILEYLDVNGSSSVSSLLIVRLAVRSSELQ